MDAEASHLAFTSSLALVGVVILVAALLSGAVERSHTPQVGVFLGLGVVLGPYGLGMLNPVLDSEIVRVVSTVPARTLYKDRSGSLISRFGPSTVCPNP